MAYLKTAVCVCAFLLAMFRGGYCKVYERCELARELKTKHRIPEAEIATWVCLARHESEFNTSAVNHVSGDHGLFQISQLFWCSPPGDGHACGLSCAQLEDDDIKDDVICARRIFREHKRLSGDGFNAWVVYRIHCTRDRVAQYVEGCFDAATTKEPDINNEVQPLSAVSSVLTTSVKTSPVTTESTTSATTKVSVSTSPALARSNSLAKHLIANRPHTSSRAKQVLIKPVPAVYYPTYVNSAAKQAAKPLTTANYPLTNNVAKRVFTKPAAAATLITNNAKQTSSTSRLPNNFPYKGFRIINGVVTYY